jgi:dipeptidase
VCRPPCQHLQSFADAYDPISFGGARFCEARVWNIFNLLVPSGEMAPYLDYAQGFNLSNRMPLWVKPARKLSVNTTMWAMRTHFEETWCEVAVPGSARRGRLAGPSREFYAVP